LPEHVRVSCHLVRWMYLPYVRIERNRETGRRELMEKLRVVLILHAASFGLRATCRSAGGLGARCRAHYSTLTGPGGKGGMNDRKASCVLVGGKQQTFSRTAPSGPPCWRKADSEVMRHNKRQAIAYRAKQNIATAAGVIQDMSKSSSKGWLRAKRVVERDVGR
jgi:hypothetical protein